MKLYVDHKLDQSGKGKFMTRIKPELEKLGVEFTDFKSCDIVLGLNKYRKNVGETKQRKIKDKKKRILRLDGVHLVKSKRNVWANRIVKQDADRSHAIIWQSEFCRKMWRGMMGVKCGREYIIWNGANEDFEIKITGLLYSKNVLLAARWSASKHRNNKRLPDQLELAMKYVKLHKDVCFYIAGDCEIPKHERVIALGHLEEVVLRSYMAKCDCMLYLASWDWCPNVVVEALVSGCPVISGNIGGHADFCPVVLDIDEMPKAKMRKNDYPPSFDEDKAIKALDHVLYGDFKWKLHPDLLIENVAKKYKKVFKEVMDENI